MSIAMGCDHTGFGRQPDVVTLLGESECRGEGLGCLDKRLTDHVDWGDYVAQTVSVSEEEARTAYCGPGLGGSSLPKNYRGEGRLWSTVCRPLCFQGFSGGREAHLFLLGVTARKLLAERQERS